jgi:predicted transposase/invertase (TIGR01784 family)
LPLAVMPLGISPLNDFAFKKTFGTPENRESLISLLNAVIKPKSPISDLTIKNPFNYQEFQEDKLSILDVKAIDDAGVLFDVEVQIRVPAELEKRIVFYGCELYTDQLREGVGYADLAAAYSIWLINGLLWLEGAQFHHAFRLTDAASGRVLDGTLAIHTIELPKYNTAYPDVSSGDVLGHWLLWLKHSQTYEPEALLREFPQPAIRRASETLIRIAQITEDKTMYDARERAIRDRKSELDSARREGELKGKIEGKIEMIRMLQGLLYQPPSDEKELEAMGAEQLESLKSSLQEQLRIRTA